MIEQATKTVIKPLTGQSESSKAGSGPDPVALKKACQQFEGLFLHQLMKEMRKTVDEGELLHGGNAEKIFMDLKDQAVSDGLAEAGGLGLAEMLYRQLLGPDEQNPLGRTNRTLADYKVGSIQREEPQEQAEEEEGFVLPVEGRLSSGFGMRMHPILGEERMHHGIDLAAPEGTSIKAAADGRVSFSGWVKGYGNLVEVDHGDGLVTRYGHNSENLVAVGEEIKAGQVLGKVGSTGQSTGPHLHFEVRRAGQAIDPYTLLEPGQKLADKDSSKQTFEG